MSASPRREAPSRHPLAAFVAFPALADVTGLAPVIDGDTIWIDEDSPYSVL